MSEDKTPIIEISQENINELLAICEPVLPAKYFSFLKFILTRFVFVLGMLQGKIISVKRLRNIIFGSKTESSKNIIRRALAAINNPKNPDLKITPNSDQSEPNPNPAPNPALNPSPHPKKKKKRKKGTAAIL